jgi:protein-S-isoprenylcysteine O-methyltransferase Ste14
MTNLLFGLGLGVAALLLGLLVTTLIVPPLRIWPTPGANTWQSYVWWPLFRGLNVVTAAVAFIARENAGDLGLPSWLRVLAAMVLLVALLLFLAAFLGLGRDKSYGAEGGLVTSGIYQWSRNPQNAMLIVVYGALGLAVDSLPAYVLCLAMMAVYALMVFAEEPWLNKAYGESYRRYCAEVPRFFNWRRALGGA